MVAIFGPPILAKSHNRRDPYDGRQSTMKTDRKKKSSTRSVKDQSLLSIGELNERIALLREEIARLETDIAKKQSSRNAADQFFKKWNRGCASARFLSRSNLRIILHLTLL